MGDKCDWDNYIIYWAHKYHIKFCGCASDKGMPTAWDVRSQECIRESLQRCIVVTETSVSGFDVTAAVLLVREYHYQPLELQHEATISCRSRLWCGFTSYHYTTLQGVTTTQWCQIQKQMSLLLLWTLHTLPNTLLSKYYIHACRHTHNHVTRSDGNKRVKLTDRYQINFVGVHPMNSL